MDNLSFSDIIFLILILFFLYKILTNIKEIINIIKFILIETTTFSESDTLDTKIQKLFAWIVFQVLTIIWYYKS